MSRVMLALALTLVASFTSPRDAHAKDIWAILEQFSGPGPFTGTSVGATFCFDGLRVEANPLLSKRASDAPRGWLLCLHGDRAKFAADPSDDGVFPRIEVALSEFGASARVHDGLDLGISAGWMTFETDARRVRPVFTPVRIVARPVLLVVGNPDNRRKWHGILSLYVKTPWVFGDITGRHFGAEPDAFTSGGEFVPSYGITFDLAALIP